MSAVLACGDGQKKARGFERINSVKLISRKGLKTFLPFVAVAITAQAGTLKVITFPVVHPVATVTTTAKVATYPVRHPVKTIKAVSPVQPRW